jgi:hypothetical protein
LTSPPDQAQIKTLGERRWRISTTFETQPDAAGIFSNAKLVSSSVTSNTGGVDVATRAINLLDERPFDYLTTDGTQTLNFGDVVRIAATHDGTGKQGGYYRFMGVDGTELDLAEADYEDFAYWYEQTATNHVPSVNLSQSDSVAVGALIIRNDVRSRAQALLEGATINAGSLTVEALEASTVLAVNDSEATSSGGSAFGEGTSLAVNGIIATNLILSDTRAEILDSDVTTTVGSLSVLASNTSVIVARNIANVTSGDTGVNVTLAFNTIGYQSQNALFNAVDALAGTDIGTRDPVITLARVQNTLFNLAGDLTVRATNDATIRASLSNETESKAEALVNASSLAVGAVLTSNMIAMETDAYLGGGSETPATFGTPIVGTSGAVTVEALETGTIVANTKLEAVATTTNDGGIGLALQTLEDIEKTDFTDRSGTQTVSAGDIVRLAGLSFTSLDTAETLAIGDRVQIVFDTDDENAGDVFEFIGAAPETDVVLEFEDYSDTDRWRRVLGEVGQFYKYIGSTPQSINLGVEDYTNTSLWSPLNGGLLGTLEELGLRPNFTDSDAAAFGGLIVRNDLRTGAQALAENYAITANGDVHIAAQSAAAIISQANSTVVSGGGSAFGEGMDLAVNGVIATNLVLSETIAQARYGSITATNPVADPEQTGAISIVAENLSRIIASLNATTESGGNSIGVNLAFNTIGFDAQNTFFQLADTLLGGVFGTEDTVRTEAMTLGLDLNAAGNILVQADSKSTIRAVLIAFGVFILLTERSCWNSTLPCCET